MKKMILTIALAIMTQALTLSPATAQQKGNGGGGIVRGGKYMTFYGAGLYVEPVAPGASQDVPGLVELVNVFTNLNYISFASRLNILSAIAPADDRKYYNVDENFLTPEIREKLTREYTRVTSADPHDLVLYALTDANTKTTYLMPEFHKLNLQDKMTILFHEAYWIINPTATYDKVISLEMSFQAMLAEPKNVNRKFQFIAASGFTKNKNELLKSALKLDYESDVLKDLYCVSPYVSKGICEESPKFISLWTLFGQDAYKCATETENAETCISLARINIYKLANQYPNSLFLNLMKSVFKTGYVLQYASPKDKFANFLLPLLTSHAGFDTDSSMRDNLDNVGIRLTWDKLTANNPSLRTATYLSINREHEEIK